MNHKKVGICIPNYNMSTYISTAIESALAQTYGNITIYILDNNSTDSSWEIISNYTNKCKNICAFKNDYTISMEENWNKLLRIASHEDYINILSSDDILLPSYTEECLKMYTTSSETLGYVYAEKYDVNNNNILNNSFFYPSSAIINRYEEFLINIKGFHTAPCQLLINNEALKNAGYLSTKFGIVSDMHLTLKLNSQHPVGYVKKYLVKYNVESGMSAKKNIIRRMVELFLELKEDIIENYLPEELASHKKDLYQYTKQFCSKFCLHKAKLFLSIKDYSTVTEFVLLSASFDDCILNTNLFRYILINQKYEMIEFVNLLNEIHYMSTQNQI